jgi:hypothetical protein
VTSLPPRQTGTGYHKGNTRGRFVEVHFIETGCDPCVFTVVAGEDHKGVYAPVRAVPKQVSISPTMAVDLRAHGVVDAPYFPDSVFREAMHPILDARWYAMTGWSCLSGGGIVMPLSSIRFVVIF